MATILRWLVWGAVFLTMGSSVPVSVVADEQVMVGLSPTMPEECHPAGLYLYETEAAGPDGCGILVDGSDHWQGALARDQRAEAKGGPTAPHVAREQPVAEVDAEDGTPVPVAGRRLVVDQDAQVMYVYEDGAEIRSLPVSTGMLTSKTFTRAWEGRVGQDMGAVPVDGGMQVEQAWHLFPDVFGNILIHSVPYVEHDSGRTYDQPEALGVRPSSHGCIRISEEDAAWLREWDPVGVPIEITGPPGPIRQAG